MDGCQKKSRTTSVYAIVFDGLDTLIKQYGREKVVTNIDFAWWQQFVLEWIGTVTQVERGNLKQLEVLEDMALRWTNNNIHVMIMKGQACATMYPRPLHRNPGDILLSF